MSKKILLFDIINVVRQPQMINESNNIVFFGGAGVSTESDIPGLHQKAGSKNVYELHGSVLRNYCMKCHKFYDAEYVFTSKGIPKCTCGGIIKPDVVLYEEGLDEETLENAIWVIQNADLMIVAGTSLTVQPASSLLNYYKGNKLVLINRDVTPYDNRANLVIHESLGKVFENI